MKLASLTSRLICLVRVSAGAKRVYSQRGKGQGALYHPQVGFPSVCWLGCWVLSPHCWLAQCSIVLDEAHFIKERSSSTARACFALVGDYKWSLSGTPLQNRVGELYSLVKLLKSDPYSYYFCRWVHHFCLFNSSFLSL
jgi:hypothetical protein